MRERLSRLYLRSGLARPRLALARCLGPLYRGFQRWRTRKPRLLTEKVEHKRWRARGGFVEVQADKLASRQLVTHTLGDGFLPELLGVANDPRQLDLASLPREFVLKPTCGSGQVLVVWQGANPEATLPAKPRGKYVIQPDRLDDERVVALCHRWLATPLKPTQWAYRRLPRQIMAEALLLDEHGAIPTDYKFYVFHGRCRYVLVIDDRFGRQTKTLVRPDWTPLDVEFDKPRATHLTRPARWEEALDVAERLGSATDFVRIDLYCLASRVVFGEFSCFPMNGKVNFHGDDFNREAGEAWQLEPAKW